MAPITVLRPDEPAPPPAAVALAERRSLPAAPVVGLVDNGKPQALALLRLLEAELRTRFGEGEVEVLRKPSAAYAIDADDATRMAARAHLVITGVGD